MKIKRSLAILLKFGIHSLKRKLSTIVTSWSNKRPIWYGTLSGQSWRSYSWMDSSTRGMMNKTTNLMMNAILRSLNTVRQHSPYSLTLSKTIYWLYPSSTLVNFWTATQGGWVTTFHWWPSTVQLKDLQVNTSTRLFMVWWPGFTIKWNSQHKEYAMQPWYCCQDLPCIVLNWYVARMITRISLLNPFSKASRLAIILK